MTTYNFTTNIEKRMPQTGAVFGIDRMTSDYAEQHPFDVDGFLESVYQEFAGTEFEESRETLRGIWKAVLSVTSPRGDASLYPNKNGATRAAAMKVWHKAGDYWRRGLRIGDTLPDMEPMCKITRLDNGAWIALFPKDMHLLGEAADVPEPHEPQRDLFAEQLQAENVRLQAQVARLKAQQRQKEQTSRSADIQQPVQPVSQPTNVVGAVAVEPPENSHVWLKTFGGLMVLTAGLLVLWQTGLLVPVGLVGLIAGGLFK